MRIPFRNFVLLSFHDGRTDAFFIRSLGTHKVRKSRHRNEDSMSRMKRTLSFRVLTIFLTLLLLQPFSWINERYGNGVVHAAIHPCSPQAIMKLGCTNADLAQLENDAVQ